PAGKKNPRNVFSSASGWLALSRRSASATGRLGGAIGPLAREHGKLLCRVRRNLGTPCADKAPRTRRKRGPALQISPATSAFHFPQKPIVRLAERNRQYQP